MDKSHREQLELVSEMLSSAECNFESNEENLKNQRISPGILDRIGLTDRYNKGYELEEILYDILIDNEIKFALKSSLHIAGDNLTNILPGRMGDPNVGSQYFTDSRHSRDNFNLIQDDRLISVCCIGHLSSGNVDGWEVGAKIRFKDVQEVFFKDRRREDPNAIVSPTNYIQINTNENRYIFKSKRKDSDDGLIYKIAEYISNNSDLDVKYDVKGPINKERKNNEPYVAGDGEEKHNFDIGWGTTERIWEKADDDHYKKESQNKSGESWQAHNRAAERSIPVDIGDEIKMGILEFSDHHTGDSRPVGEYESFTIFVRNAPDSLGVGDAIGVKVTSINNGRTSATATFVELLEQTVSHISCVQSIVSFAISAQIIIGRSSLQIGV